MPIFDPNDPTTFQGILDPTGMVGTQFPYRTEDITSGTVPNRSALMERLGSPGNLNPLRQAWGLSPQPTGTTQGPFTDIKSFYDLSQKTDAGPQAAGPSVQPSTYAPSLSRPQAAGEFDTYMRNKYGSLANRAGASESPELIEMSALNDLMERPDVQRAALSGNDIFNRLSSRYDTLSKLLGAQTDAVEKANLAQAQKTRDAQALRGIYELNYGPGMAGGADEISPENMKLINDMQKNIATASSEQAKNAIAQQVVDLNTAKAEREKPIDPKQIQGLVDQKAAQAGYQKTMTKAGLPPTYIKPGGLLSRSEQATPEQVGGWTAEARSELQAQQGSATSRIRQTAPGYGRPAGGGPVGSLDAETGATPEQNYGTMRQTPRPIEETDPGISHILQMDRENPNNPTTNLYNTITRRLIAYGMAPDMAKRAAAQIVLNG